MFPELRFTEAEIRKMIDSATPEAVFAAGDISGSAAISAAVHADTPPSATSAPTGERPYLGVIVQTVSCAAAIFAMASAPPFPPSSTVPRTSPSARMSVSFASPA